MGFSTGLLADKGEHDQDTGLCVDADNAQRCASGSEASRAGGTRVTQARTPLHQMKEVHGWF